LYKIIQNRKSLAKEDVILSNAYFSVNEELKNVGYQVFCPSWYMSHDRNIFSSLDIFFKSERIKYKLRNSDFIKLLRDDFIDEIDQFEKKLTILFKKRKIKSIFVPNDVDFFENLSIHICKQIGIPSFIFLHGLPGRFNRIDDNRSDYLIVWGEKIKENYIKAGMNPNKIFISGHPYYKQIHLNHLKFSFDRVLVLTKPLAGAHHSDGVILGDRANLLLYLYSIEKILKTVGIKSVRFRPHPCENGSWYLKFINNDFYKLDKGNLQQSIQNSSLIIGPASTVFLESLFYNVNYIIYEPSLNNIDLINYQLVPPFDGTDSKIPVSKNEAELEYMLKNKLKVDPTCLKDYITTPFDISFVKNLI
ncbi:MAG TPA: hypothetical protein VIK14_08965, partial [Ignavibacteria bacterium]